MLQSMPTAKTANTLVSEASTMGFSRRQAILFIKYLSNGDLSGRTGLGLRGIWDTILWFTEDGPVDSRLEIRQSGVETKPKAVDLQMK